MPHPNKQQQYPNHGGGGGCQWGGCIMGVIATVWVNAYHAALGGSMSDEGEGAEIRMSLIQHDLSACASRLVAREAELETKIRTITADAARRKEVGDIAGARRKLVDRRRAQAQLEKIISSISVIDMHMNTIEGTELNRSILDTLRASGDALKRLGASGGGIEEVERIVSDVEQQVDAASEITRVIHSANVSGTINSMGHDVATDEELEAELNELLLLDKPTAGSEHNLDDSEDADHPYIDLSAAPRVPNLQSGGGELRVRRESAQQFSNIRGNLVPPQQFHSNDNSRDISDAEESISPRRVSSSSGGPYARLLAGAR